ncbi:NAD dependent epimerase/dehydratase family protein [Nitzschia inconspicua]|uniref:NAD dependent epimerase/dehydratase family protein n=1 Tax=Nitzschia inconspicua TaxID=303405 RepID=A0A9K3L299_9STRA|nr:NAD dependent epimerase/dehydratase family protein [Nitzschia inconspicua]
MAEIASISPFIYVATFFFVLSAISSDLLFIRISLTGGFLFLVLASLSGQNSSGSFDYIPLSDGIIDIPMFVNMALFCLNFTIVLRLIRDEQPHGKLTPDEEALFRFFQSRSGMTPLQFQYVLQNGEFVEFPPNTVVPKCASTLYLVIEGKVICKTTGNCSNHTFFKRSGEFFDIKLFNLFSLPVGFDNSDIHAKTLTATKCFRWNVYGLVAMREAKSPSLIEYWEYLILTSLTGAAIRHHLKRDDTLYDSLMIPERKEWLEGARSRDFLMETTTEAGTWGHWKEQFATIRSSLMHVIPPRGVRQHPALPHGINPKQAYLELLCKAAEREYAAEEQQQTANTTESKVITVSSKSKKGDVEMGCFGLSVAIVALLLLVNPVTGLATLNPKPKLLVLGLGRVGLEVARTTLNTFEQDDQPIHVVGTVRDASVIGSIDDGIQRIAFEPDAVQKELMGLGDTKIGTATHVLFTIPLQREPDPTMEQVWNHVQEWWDEYPEGKLGVISTTGVFGDHEGRRVTEESPLLCQTGSNANLYRRLEEHWIRHAEQSTDSDDIRLLIFRCAGIYDRTRSALHTIYKSGYDVPSKKELSTATAASKTNRIHTTDIARAVVNGLFLYTNKKGAMNGISRIYNLADDEPESRDVVLLYAKELLLSIGCSLPNPVSSKTPSRSSTSRQSRRTMEQKLVDNQRMKEELLSKCGLIYPSYREGLKSILTDPSTPWHQAKQKQQLNSVS